MEPILTALNDKLGDNIVKTRQLAEESLMGMAEHQSFGVNICINSFLKASSTSSSKEGATKKAMQSTKHLVGRQIVILKMLQSYEISDKSLIRELVSYCVKAIQNNLQDVRIVAYKCMSELYRIVGPTIRDQLDGLRPAQME